MGCRGSAGWFKKGRRDLGRARPNRKVAGDHGDAAWQLRSEEGGADGWGRSVSGGAGERGAGEQRRQVGPGAQGERATRGVMRAGPVARGR